MPDTGHAVCRDCRCVAGNPAFRVRYELESHCHKDPTTGKYRNIQETYPTEAAAWDRLMRLRLQETDGTLIPPSRITIAQFSERWLAAKRATVRPTSVATYRTAITCINKHLGHLKLKDIDAPAILAWHATLLEDGLSATTVNEYHAVLKMMCRDAVKWNLLARSAVEGVTPPRRDRVGRQVWSRPQIEQFLAYITGTDHEAMWRLAITTGVRVGELLALQ